MSLISRLSTLFKADAHGVVDALEDRALVLRQHVREAGAELARKRCRLESFDVEEKDLEAETQAVDQEKQKLEDDIALALNDGAEELARFAIKKLLPLRQRGALVERRLEALSRERGELAEELAVQQAEFEELERRARAYMARLEQPGAVPEGAPGAFWHEPVADEEVELELLRRRQRAEKGGA